MKRRIPGLHIQWPWSRLIVDGKKSVETRSYPLPEKYINVELAIIETSGPRGRKEAGINEARIIGTVVFSGSFKYESKKAWAADFKSHCVSAEDPQYSWQPNKEKWGWRVEKVTKFKCPVKPPKKRGIVFASNCEI